MVSRYSHWQLSDWKYVLANHFPNFAEERSRQQFPQRETAGEKVTSLFLNLS